MTMSHEVGFLDGAGHAGEPADRAETDIEVEDLAESDVEAADATADGGGEGAFDADEVFAEIVEGFLGEPVAGGVERFFAGEDFVPMHFSGSTGGDFDGRVEDSDAGFPDIGTGSVTFDEWDDGVVGDVEPLSGHGDGSSHVCEVRVPLTSL